MAEDTKVYGREQRKASDTLLHPSRTPAKLSRNFPDALLEKYEVIRQFDTGGSEADIFLAKDKLNDSQLVIKLYRQGITPKTEVLEQIAQAAPEHVIKLVAHGQADDVWYEVMEFASEGSLRDRLKSAIPTEQARGILRELYEALSHLHSRGIIHRDIKPENILIRSSFPLDLVLTDFGIASISKDEKTHWTNLSRTLAYSAPEAGDELVVAKSDWWSLGIVMYEVLVGKTPFSNSNIAERGIPNFLRNNPIDLSAITDIRWNTLLKGLLHRNHEKRWGEAEVKLWLEGANVRAVDDIAGGASTAGFAPFNGLPGGPYFTPAELAVGLSNYWDEGQAALARGEIRKWVLKDVQDIELADFLVDLTERQDLSLHEKLARVIQRFNPDLPPMWKGIELTAAGILSLANDARRDPSLREKLKDIVDGGLKASPELEELADRIKAVRLEYEKAWVALGDEGKKNVARPEEVSDLPSLVLISESKEFCEKLRSTVLATVDSDAKACYWFSGLGNPEWVAAPWLLVMMHSHRAASEWQRLRQIRLQEEEAARVRRELQEREEAEARIKAEEERQRLKAEEAARLEVERLEKEAKAKEAAARRAELLKKGFQTFWKVGLLVSVLMISGLVIKAVLDERARVQLAEQQELERQQQLAEIEKRNREWLQESKDFFSKGQNYFAINLANHLLQSDSVSPDIKSEASKINDEAKEKIIGEAVAAANLMTDLYVKGNLQLLISASSDCYSRYGGPQNAAFECLILDISGRRITDILTEATNTAPNDYFYETKVSERFASQPFWTDKNADSVGGWVNNAISFYSPIVNDAVNKTGIRAHIEKVAFEESERLKKEQEELARREEAERLAEEARQRREEARLQAIEAEKARLEQSARLEAEALKRQQQQDAQRRQQELEAQRRQTRTESSRSSSIGNLQKSEVVVPDQQVIILEQGERSPMGRPPIRYINGKYPICPNDSSGRPMALYKRPNSAGYLENVTCAPAP